MLIHQSTRKFKFFAISILIIGIILPIDLILILGNFLDGLKYIDTGYPVGYEEKNYFFSVIYIYLIPSLTFFIAGFYLGRKITVDGIKNGIILGLLWFFIGIIAIYLQFIVFFRDQLYTLDHASLFFFFIKTFFLLTVISATGGKLGEMSTTKKEHF